MGRVNLNLQMEMCTLNYDCLVIKESLRMVNVMERVVMNKLMENGMKDNL